MRRLACAVILLVVTGTTGCATSGSSADLDPSSASASSPGRVIGTGATSNVTVDASADGSVVAVGWYALDEASGKEAVLVATSRDGGRTFGAPVLVASPAIQFPSVAVLDDGTVLVSAITYDLTRTIDPDDPRSWPSWPVIYRSRDTGATFELMADLRKTVGPRVLTGAMPTSMAATGDGRTVVITFQDKTPPGSVPSGTPTWKEGTSVIPTFAVVSTDSGRSFRTPTPVAASTCSCCQSSAFTFEGRAGAAMRLIVPVSDKVDVRDPAMTVAGPTGRFPAPTLIHDDGYELPLDGCPASGPGVDGAGGVLHAAWWTGAAGREGWWYSRGSGPSTMGDPVRLPADSTITYSVHLAATAGGAAYIVGMHWGDATAGNHLWVWRVGADGAPALLDTAPPVAVAAQAYDIADVHDAAMLAWIDGSSVRVETVEP